MSRPWKDRISPKTRLIMNALLDTIVPSEGHARPGAIDLNLVDRLLDWFGGIRLAAPGFIIACLLYDFVPFTQFRFRRFHRLSLDQRTHVLERFEAGGFLRRWAFVLFKSAVLAAFYRTPEVWQHIGYNEGCLSRLPAARQED